MNPDSSQREGAMPNPTRFLLATISLIAPFTAGALSQEPAGSVSGSVVDAQSQAPFPGVLVIIQGVGQANTDENGRFTIPNVRPGKHNIQAMRSGMARPMREGGPRTIVVAP